MNNRVIIFDFDGVISLSDDSRFAILQEVANRYGLTVEDDMLPYIIGDTTINFFSNCFPDISYSLVEDIIHDYAMIYKENILDYSSEIPVITNFIKQHNDSYTFAVASTNNVAIIEKVLDKFNILQYFSCIVGREHVVNKKPHAEVYLKVAEVLQVDPSRCIAIEDSAIGAMAAIKANVVVVGLLNGLNSVNDFRDLSINAYIGPDTDVVKLIKVLGYKSPSTSSA